MTATERFARAAPAAELSSLEGDLAHPAAGLVVLLVVQALNLYKPRGLTRYGHRRRRSGDAGG